MKRSGSAALAARCITERASCPISSRCCQGRVQAGLFSGEPGEALRAALMPRQRAHGRRRWTTSTAAWSLLWKRRLGNLKSSWVTSALLSLFFTLLAPKKATLSSRQLAPALVTIHRSSSSSSSKTTVTTLGTLCWEAAASTTTIRRYRTAYCVPPCPPSPPRPPPSTQHPAFCI